MEVKIYVLLKNFLSIFALNNFTYIPSVIFLNVSPLLKKVTLIYLLFVCFVYMCLCATVLGGDLSFMIMELQVVLSCICRCWELYCRSLKEQYELITADPSPGL